MTATLAERAMAPGGFRWLPGMRETYSGYRVLYVDECGPCFVRPGPSPDRRWLNNVTTWLTGPPTPPTPDLNDPLTVLALLLLVRDAWRSDVYIEARPVLRRGPVRWFVRGGAVGPNSQLNGRNGFASEVEALVVALECAP